MRTVSNFIEFCNESLDNPLPIKWKIKDIKMVGKFTIEKGTGAEAYYDSDVPDRQYVIVAREAEDMDISVWRYRFYFNDGGDRIYSLTDFNKDKFKVLSTVADGFKYVNDMKKPDAMVFTSNVSEESRVKLYDSLSSMACKKLGYKLRKYHTTNGVGFILYKNPEHLSKLISLMRRKTTWIDKLKEEFL